MPDKKEVPFVTIDDRYYGGNQEWADHFMMRLGGCSTVTASEISICLARDERGRALYAHDPYHVTMPEFLAFFKQMYEFVHPDINGLTNVERYAAELQKYARSHDVTLGAEFLHGEATLQEAERFIEHGIDQGIPLAFLLLKHKDRHLSDFEWHWFNVTGWERKGGKFWIIVGTYGARYLLDLEHVWNTGYSRKGGIVRMFLTV